MISWLLVAAGVALLYYGGELLVNGAIRLAQGFGISPLIIGLTVVAFATSAPELAATLTAALQGAPDIAIGNALGSNVANLGLILGLSALLSPLTVKSSFIRREVAFMVLVTIMLYPLFANGAVSRVEGGFLVLLLGTFLYGLLREPGAAETQAVKEDGKERPLFFAALAVLAGLGLLVGGAQMLVTGASDLARAAGVPERVIGLTLVALGTSLPELATSLVAARRREADIVLGNVVGSNIFNLLCVLGFTALVHPIAVAPQALALDFWVMLGITLVVLVMLLIGRSLTRLEGAILLSIYLGYVTFLFF